MRCTSGKIYGIVGYNGSGKTVLFKCICGFLNVDAGEITVNGKVMGKELDMLDNAGIIIEEPGYIRNLSGYRNLEYFTGDAPATGDCTFNNGKPGNINFV